jgi:hypothetical protein
VKSERCVVVVLEAVNNFLWMVEDKLEVNELGLEIYNIGYIIFNFVSKFITKKINKVLSRGT